MSIILELYTNHFTNNQLSELGAPGVIIQLTGKTEAKVGERLTAGYAWSDTGPVSAPQMVCSQALCYIL